MQASRILPLVSRHHFLLVTLLLFNSLANEVRLSVGWVDCDSGVKSADMDRVLLFDVWFLPGVFAKGLGRG